MQTQVDEGGSIKKLNRKKRIRKRDQVFADITNAYTDTGILVLGLLTVLLVYKFFFINSHVGTMAACIFNSREHNTSFLQNIVFGFGFLGCRKSFANDLGSAKQNTNVFKRKSARYKSLLTSEEHVVGLKKNGNFPPTIENGKFIKKFPLAPWFSIFGTQTITPRGRHFLCFVTSLAPTFFPDSIRSSGGRCTRLRHLDTHQGMICLLVFNMFSSVICFITLYG